MDEEEGGKGGGGKGLEEENEVWGGSKRVERRRTGGTERVKGEGHVSKTSSKASGTENSSLLDNCNVTCEFPCRL